MNLDSRGFLLPQWSELEACLSGTPTSHTLSNVIWSLFLGQLLSPLWLNPWCNSGLTSTILVTRQAQTTYGWSENYSLLRSVCTERTWLAQHLIWFTLVSHAPLDSCNHSGLQWFPKASKLKTWSPSCHECYGGVAELLEERTPTTMCCVAEATGQLISHRLKP